MKINEISKEELESMSYTDITEILLGEKTKQTTAELFKKIVEVLSLPASTFEKKVGDFYTALANDKRYILLDDGKWDLRKNHKSEKLIIEEDNDEVELEDRDDLDIEEEDDPLYDEETDDDISDITEEYKDLVIVDEEDLENE